MLIERFYHPWLAQASYMVACQTRGEALVVDPNRQIEMYQQAAQRAGVRIVAVAETHIHADFVSGARELARSTGACLHLSAEGPAEWQYRYATEDGVVLLQHGDRLVFGYVGVEVLHTPGHTPEHLAFLITDGEVADAPMGMISGDFIFVGDVGRPDLLERVAGHAGSMHAAAIRLFESLQATNSLPEYLQIWPGHGAGSSCGKALGAVAQTTLGYERRFSWAFRQASQQAFVQEVLTDQPEPPPYFVRMKHINRDGPPARPNQAIELLTQEQLIIALDTGALLIDLRQSDVYAAGHIRGALNLPYGPMLLNWGGWLANGEQAIVLVGSLEQAESARAELLLIGMDRIIGSITPGDVAAWMHAGRPGATFRRRSAADLRAQIEAGATVIDVRRPAEYAAGHIPGSRNLPLGGLPQLVKELPPICGPIVVHCQGGGRSPIAAGILAAHG
ncbi:MAG: rhodanese-like domain-containing protein, partial [Roseiflexaceae bacterium]|nr:rhodanese-like domain-containing protein [Roseiflexaceae bacterium]